MGLTEDLSLTVDSHKREGEHLKMANEALENHLRRESKRAVQKLSRSDDFLNGFKLI